MEQQQKDEKRSVTYKTGYSLDSNDVSDHIRVAEMKRKVLFKVTYTFMVAL